ncbi:WD40 repeat domain-containing protein [Deinococcus hopiensis]|uniref:FOG: WD40 repeat n=1 Tax=Deinococcus hopiensis KR-140 TaxID=695939 RepID=A0A1W1UZ78_9DEIO|nr:WD40 repeat domain-containing protein [Deinococcus hopiensis]SMB86407.1 FOG: WD40 repeat [Deinococcus hopiensis KR-140]
MKRLLWFPLLLSSLACAAPLTLQDTLTFVGHPGAMAWGTLTPDGQSVFSQGGNTLIEWDAETGQPRRVLQPLNGKDFAPVRQDFWRSDSPDGVRVLVTENTARQPGSSHLSLLNLHSGRVDASFEVQDGPLGLTWGTGQRAVAFADREDGKIWFWHEGMAQPDWLQGGTRWEFGRTAFSADNSVLYVLGEDLSAYDSTSGKALWTLAAGDLRGRDGRPVRAWRKEFGDPVFVSSPFSPRLLVQTSDGLALLDPQARTLLAYLDPGFDRVREVKWSPDGTKVLLVTDSYVHVVDVGSGQTLGLVDGENVIGMPDGGSVWTQMFSHFLHSNVSSGLDVETVKAKTAWNAPVSVDARGRPSRWLGRGKAGYSVFTPRGQVPLTEHFTRLARSSPDGQTIASLGDDQLWLLDTQTHAKRLSVPVGDAFDFAFSPDGRWLAVGGWNTTRLLDAHTGETVKVLEPTSEQRNSGGRKWQPGPRGLNRSLAFSPDGQQLAVGYEASTIGLWDVASGQLTRTLGGGRGWVLSLAFSPDGARLVSGWGDGTLHFYGVRSGEVSPVQQVNQGFVRWLAFSPDGKQVAAASGDGSVSLWTPLGRPLHRLTGHTGAATTVTYLDAGTLVSGDTAGTLRVWNAENGRLLGQTDTRGAVVQSLALSPDGRQLLSSDRDNALRVYGVPK